MSPRLDAEEERDLAAALSALHDPDDANAARDAEVAAEVDAILRRESETGSGNPFLNADGSKPWAARTAGS